MLQIVPKLSSIGILYKWFCFQRDFLVQSVEGHSMVVGLLSLLIESGSREEAERERSGTSFSFTNKPDGTVTKESRVPVPGKFSEWPSTTQASTFARLLSSHAHSIVLRVARLHSEMKRI